MDGDDLYIHPDRVPEIMNVVVLGMDQEQVQITLREERALRWILDWLSTDVGKRMGIIDLPHSGKYWR